ncbi:MAG TPA: PfkB family carbohydrate kinase [Patescibacteria group bacterium]|nr:PfkB family carbohydrate kinase [Patescibacteria group bacterium]
MIDFTVVGHIAIDRIITQEDERIQLGGPPTFVTLCAQLLGGSVEAVTKMGEDMPTEYIQRLKELSLDVSDQIVEGSQTTRFVLDYRHGERALSVESVCANITAEDVERLHDAALLAPIMDEVPSETIDAIESEVLALDPQGFLRRVGDGGVIEPKSWIDEGLMGRLSVVKCSEAELKLMTGAVQTIKGLRTLIGLGVHIAIATRGEVGSLLAIDKRLYDVPSVKYVALVDSTGAGDVFMGTFFREYLRDEDPLWCASLGAAMASAVVETPGAIIEKSVKAVRERAEAVLDGITKF